MSTAATPEHCKLAARLREVLATYEKQKDLILLGAYEKGSDPRVDYAISMIDRANAFLKQGTHEKVGFEETIAHLKRMFG